MLIEPLKPTNIETMEAETLLRETEERYRLLVSSVKDYAIIMLDPSGYIVSWNEGAYRLKGWTAQEIIGQHFTKFYEPEDVAAGKTEWELREAVATGRFEDEGWRVRKDGTKFWANVVFTALRGENGELRGFAKVTRDMTERKRAEDRLKIAQESLELRVQSRTKELEEAIEARDEFLSIASHELRTPLTALKLQQQILDRLILRAKDGVISVKNLKEMTALIGRQTDQLIRLVDDMLDVSRLANGKLSFRFERRDLVEVVSDVFKTFQNQFEEHGIAADFSADENIFAQIDRQRFSQVVANLLSNAIKYGGDSIVKVTVRAQDHDAILTVSDCGPGIAVQDQTRIFDRFERATSANEASGLGLGLFISRQIVEAHKGSISVSSQPGNGATFSVHLPLGTDLTSA